MERTNKSFSSLLTVDTINLLEAADESIKSYLRLLYLNNLSAYYYTLQAASNIKNASL